MSLTYEDKKWILRVAFRLVFEILCRAHPGTFRSDWPGIEKELLEQ